ncbi:MAG: pyridoxal 5'-phosphate synthase [Flavobacteriales bacterium]|nr:pyridoxal 5'-phosphate synthase [Flavobacteriales bacterium]
MKENPFFCANFYWEDLSRQVRFEGKATKVAPEISDEYFASRPRESQIGAWASDQSSTLKSRKELEEKLRELKNKFEGAPVPRPPHWGGYLLIPSKVEFWQGRESRLHDRLEYTQNGNSWKLDRLSP